MRFLGLDSHKCGVLAPIDPNWRPRKKHDKGADQKTAANKINTAPPEKSKEETEKERKWRELVADRLRLCDWFASDKNPDSQAAMTFFRNALANSLHLDVASIPPDVRFDGKGGAWTKTYDQHGKVIGHQVRFYATGDKRNSGHLGISYSEDWNADSGATMFFLEGNSNRFSLRDPNINHSAAISRASNLASKEILAEWLVFQGFEAGGRYENRDLIIFGDNDQKADGYWPGREGAEATGQVVANHVERNVKMCFPPPQYKDIRDWVIALRASRNYADAAVIFWDWIENHYEVIKPNACRPIQPGETVDQFAQRQIDFIFGGPCDNKFDFDNKYVPPPPPPRRPDPVIKIIDDAGILPPHKVRHLDRHGLWTCGTHVAMDSLRDDRRFIGRVDCNRWIDCPHCHAVNQHLAAIRLGGHVYKLKSAFIYSGHAEHVEAVKEQMDNAERRRLKSVARLKTRMVFKIDPKDSELFKFVSDLVFKAIRVRERSNSRANRQLAAAKLSDIAKELAAKLGHRNEALCTRRLLEARRTQKLGNYARITKIGGVQFLIADRAFRGARKVTGPEGVAELCAAIKSIPSFYCTDEDGTRKPVTSSAAWQPVKKENGVKKFVIDTEAKKMIDQIAVVKGESTMDVIRDRFADYVSQPNQIMIARATDTMFINLGREAYHAGLRRLVREINPSADDVSEDGEKDFEIDFGFSRSWSLGDDEGLTTNSVKSAEGAQETAYAGARAGP
jgi:hypothetical protein